MRTENPRQGPLEDRPVPVPARYVQVRCQHVHIVTATSSPRTNLRRLIGRRAEPVAAPRADATHAHIPRPRPARTHPRSIIRRAVPQCCGTATRVAAVSLVVAGALAGCGTTGSTTLKPGESLNSAAARAGKDGIVHIPAGTWPAQTVNTGTSGDCATRAADPAATRDCRTFIVDHGAKVTIGNLRMEGAGTAILATRGDLRINGVYSLSGATESVVSGAIITPGRGDPGVYLDHVTRFQLRDSEVTGVDSNDGVDIYGGPTGSKDVLIQDNLIHNVSIAADSCQHTDGIQSAGTSGPGNTGTVIRGNTITNIAQNGLIQLDTAKGQVGTNETVENNTLGTALYTPTSCVPNPSPRALNVSGNNLTVRGNVSTSGAPFLVYPGTGLVENNTVPLTSGACSNYTWRGNRYTQSPRPGYATNC